MRFLVFGDVVGRPGRVGIGRALAELRAELEPDSVIINIENIAHGSGISPETVREATSWGADVYTTGDHAWDNSKGIPLLDDRSVPIIRPANYPPGVPGRGFHIFTVGAYSVAVINLQGQVFFRRHPLNPFFVLDELLARHDIQSASIVLVDFHAEATSEKRAFGLYADGRISAVWGTHTHVPTADAQVLPKGTGYLSDVGMNGALHSVIGVDPVGPLKTFLQQVPAGFDPPEASGPYEVNALLLDIDPKTGHTTAIAHVRKIVNDG